jgi:ribosomal protein S18 acetylase RimI-like enzyme
VSTACQIEPFTETHLEGVVAVCAAEGWASWTTERTAKAFSAPGVIAIVAVDGADVVGVAELLTDGEVMAYLAVLVVAEGARGRGIGKALVHNLFERAGLARMDLLAEIASTGFYESFEHKPKPGYRIYA